MLTGVTPNLYDISPRELREGRIFNVAEARAGMRVAVLGESLADALFPSGNVTGRAMTLDGVEFQILGVFQKAKGGFFGENGLDRQVVIPFETAKLRYPASDNFLITARAVEGKRDEALEEMRAALRKLRHTAAKVDADSPLNNPHDMIQDFQNANSMN